MKIPTRYAIRIVMILVLVTGCTTPPEVAVEEEVAPPVQPKVAPVVEIAEEPPRGQPSLAGPEWQLSWLYGTNRVPQTAATPVYLQFTETEVFGYTGVNRITGMYSQQGDEGLRFGTLASTKMAGPHLAFELQFHENLGLVRGYYITGDTYEESTLVLFGGHGREEIILAEFVPHP